MLRTLSARAPSISPGFSATATTPPPRCATALSPQSSTRKAFWRVDKEREPELRHPVLAQVAYADLQRRASKPFLAGADGTGWRLPATLRLADYALGHDARAREPQPVATRLGPRYLDWQLAQDPAASWVECDAHAALLEATLAPRPHTHRQRIPPLRVRKLPPPRAGASQHPTRKPNYSSRRERNP